MREALEGHDAPQTLEGVTALGWSGQLVEVEVVAAVQSRRLELDWTDISIIIGSAIGAGGGAVRLVGADDGRV